MNLESVTNTQTFQQQLNVKPKTAQKEIESNAKFEDVIKSSQPKEVEDKITSMIDTVDKLKETLDYDMSVENLMEYKKALKSFVEYYTKNELQVQDVMMTDRKGYTKKLQIVKTLNEKLNNMTTSMLETHLGHLQMLKDIGEIQGLVLNLYL